MPPPPHPLTPLHPVIPTEQDERQEPGADFKPNLINTVCFLVNFIIQVGASLSAFSHPHVHGLRGCCSRQHVGVE